MTKRSLRAAETARPPRWMLACMLVAGAIVVAFAYSLVRRGINLTDEGYLLSQVVDMLGGKVLYRDMDAFVTPGIWFLLAGLFKVAEPSVLTSRIISFSGYLGTLYVSYRIVTGLTSRAWGWSAVGLLMVFAVWAFPAWTSTFYSPISIFFALTALDRLLSWRGGQRVQDMVLCGLFLGLSIWCKQNYGVFATAGTVLGLIAFQIEDRRPLSDALRCLLGSGLQLAAGAATVVLPTIAYLAYYDALGAAFELLVLHPFEFMSRQDIAYPPLSMLWSASPLAAVDALTYGAYSLSQAPNPFYSTNVALGWLHGMRALERLHVLLFWLPAAGLIVGGVLALRPKDPEKSIDGELFAVLAFASFVFAGVFPRADFNHLINVYQPVVVAGVLIASRAAVRFGPPKTIAARSGVAFGCTLLFAYSAIAGSWYHHMLENLNAPIGGPRGGVLVTTIDQQMIHFQVDAILERTREGEAVLTVPALAMFNFLTNRPVPGRYYNLYEHHIAHDGGAGVVDAAEAHDVNLVVSDYNNFFSDRIGLRVYAPKLASYLRRYFEPLFDFADYRHRFLIRRSVPLEETRSADIIGGCEFPLESSAYSRERLLFASLYQARNVLSPRVSVDTACIVSVPEQAQLAVSIGYRRPEAAARNAVVKAEIWVVYDGEREQLLSKIVPIKPQGGWASPIAPEFRVDLGKYAGREVSIRFRATFRGAVRMSPFDLGGLALIWQDPRIEFP